MGKLVVYRDRQLIVSSKIIEDYPLLLEFFNNTPEMDEKELYTLSEQMQLFFKNIYQKVKKESISEWDIDLSHPIDILDDKHKIRCQLCNHNIKNVCHIINKTNGKRLKIGTECVKHFGIDKSVPIDKLLEERVKTKRLEELNNLFPGIEGKVSQWSLIIESQPIFIKKDVKLKYVELGERASELLKLYCEKSLNHVEKEKIIEELRYIFYEKNKEIDKINKYVQENKYNKFIPRKEIIQSLLRNNEVQALNWLEEDGVIKGRTMFRITDEQFVKSLIPDFNKHLIKANCYIEDFAYNRGNIGYIISCNNNVNIKLFCNYSQFCIQYCGVVTNEKMYTPLSFIEILKMSSIYGEQSIEYAIGIFESSLNKYGIKFDEIYYDYNDVIIYDKINRKSFFVNLLNLLQKYKYFAFKMGNDTVDSMYTYLLSEAKVKYSKKDIDDIKKKREKNI